MKKYSDKDRKEQEEPERRRLKRTTGSVYERTRRAVYATGNRWAIENFNATHN